MMAKRARVMRGRNVCHVFCICVIFCTGFSNGFLVSKIGEKILNLDNYHRASCKNLNIENLGAVGVSTRNVPCRLSCCTTSLPNTAITDHSRLC